MVIKLYWLSPSPDAFNIMEYKQQIVVPTMEILPLGVES